MTNFVWQQKKIIDETGSSEYEKLAFSRCYEYANILKEPLTLGMFVPCDLEGNVLEDPKNLFRHETGLELKEWNNEIIKFEKAKQRVLFSNCSYRKRKVKGAKAFICFENGRILSMGEDNLFGLKTVEDLIDFEPKLKKALGKR